MKKILIIVFLVLFSGQVAFGYVEPVGCGTQGNCQYKTPTQLTKDVADLQAQVDLLVQKNTQLEFKISQFQKQTVSTPQNTVVSPVSDTVQIQRIDTLEKRVGLIETATSALKTTLNKTVDLLTKLLSLLK